MKVKLWLRVENNNKFVRGKGKARDEIERRVLGHFGMEKTTKDGYEYILSIPYTNDEELERYDDIYAEAEHIATTGTVSLKATWPRWKIQKRGGSSNIRVRRADLSCTDPLWPQNERIVVVPL